MKLLEISKKGKTILVGEGIGKSEIKTPIEIKFIVDETDYQKLNQATNYYKWSMHEALTMLCKYSEEFIAEMELDIDNKFREQKDTEEDEFWKISAGNKG